MQIVVFFHPLHFSLSCQEPSYITSAKGLGERGPKMAIFADVADVADIVGGPKKVHVYADVI